MIPHLGQKFRIRRPLPTHWRLASCAEVDCPHYLNGWMTIVPAADPLCDWVRYKSGRAFTEKPIDGGLMEFTFAAGQECFRQIPPVNRSQPDRRHRLPIGRQEIFDQVQGGIVRTHARPEDWVEHSATEFDKIRELRKRG